MGVLKGGKRENKMERERKEKERKGKKSKP